MMGGGSFCKLGKHQKKNWNGRLLAAELNECFKVATSK